MDENYHLFKNGRLEREDDTLAVRTEDDNLHHLPVENVRALFFHGQIHFNTRALDFLTQNEIPAHVFNWNEYYTGTYVPRRSLVSGNSLVKQVEHYSDSTARLKIAKEFVRAAGSEMRRNATYYSNRGYDLDLLISDLEEFIEAVDECETVDDLLGHEGTLRNRYYQLFATVLPDAFEFERREYYPPPNEVNSLISFGNSLLYSAILTELYSTHLNPTVSYLHEPSERRYSLCLDLSEVFKPVLVDRLIFRLVNRSQITVDDFEDDLNGCLLSDHGRRAFVREFESLLEKTVEHPTLSRKTSYQYLLRLEGYKLHKHLLGDQKYDAFRRWW